MDEMKTSDRRALKKYSNFVLPKKEKKKRKKSYINFTKTVDISCKMFGERSSLFYARWKYLNLEKSKDESFNDNRQRPRDLGCADFRFLNRFLHKV